MVARDIGCLSSSTKRSNIDLVVMYCATLVWRQEIYSPIGSSPASAIDSPILSYYQRLLRHQGILPVIRYATQLWRLPSNLRMLGVTTHESDPKSIRY